MTLEERLDADLKDAMRSGDNVRKLAIRAVKTAITEAKVSGTEQRTLTDEDVMRILRSRSSSAATASPSSPRAAAPTWSPRKKPRSRCWRTTCRSR